MTGLHNRSLQFSRYTQHMLLTCIHSTSAVAVALKLIQPLQKTAHQSSLGPPTQAGWPVRARWPLPLSRALHRPQRAAAAAQTAAPLPPCHHLTTCTAIRSVHIRNQVGCVSPRCVQGACVGPEKAWSASLARQRGGPGAALQSRRQKVAELPRIPGAAGTRAVRSAVRWRCLAWRDV